MSGQKSPRFGGGAPSYGVSAPAPKGVFASSSAKKLGGASGVAAPTKAAGGPSAPVSAPPLAQAPAPVPAPAPAVVFTASPAAAVVSSEPALAAAQARVEAAPPPPAPRPKQLPAKYQQLVESPPAVKPSATDADDSPLSSPRGASYERIVETPPPASSAPHASVADAKAEGRVAELEGVVSQLLQSQQQLERDNARILASLAASPKADTSSASELSQAMEMMRQTVARAAEAEARAVRFEAELRDFKIAFQKSMEQKVASAETKAKAYEGELTQLRASIRPESQRPGGGIRASVLGEFVSDTKRLEATLQSMEEKLSEMERQLKRGDEANRKLEAQLARSEEKCQKAELVAREKEIAVEHLTTLCSDLTIKSSGLEEQLKARATVAPAAVGSSTAVGSAGTEDLQRQLKEAEAKVAAHTSKLELATKGLRQYKADKERFQAAEVELARLRELVRRYEDFTSLTPEMIMKTVPESPVSTSPAPPSKPASRAVEASDDMRLDEILAPASKARLGQGSPVSRQGPGHGSPSLTRPQPKEEKVTFDPPIRGGGPKIPSPATPVKMNVNALAPQHQFEPKNIDEQTAALYIPNKAKASHRPPAPAEVVAPPPEDDFDPRGKGAAAATPGVAAAPAPKGVAKPFEEPVFEYENKEEDAVLKRILAIKEKVTEQPPTGPVVVDTSTPLRAAANAAKPDLDKVMQILKSGKEPLDPKWTTTSRATLLHLCAAKNEVGLMQQLIKMEARLDVKDIDGQTPLHMAAFYGNYEAADLLLKANCGRELDNSSGATPLGVAAEGGHLRLVQLLLAFRPNLEHADNRQRMATHLAARGGNPEIMKLLLQDGAFIDAEDDQCFTPLLLAEQLGKRAVADLLLEAGADPHACSRRGDTLLWTAIEAGDMARVEQLHADHRLDINRPAGSQKWTALHRACLHIDDLPTAERVVAQLLKFGARADVRNAEEKTPLFFACLRGSLPMARALVLAGSNPNAVDVAQNTPLHFCRSAEVATFLFQRTAKPNNRNKQGNTPLHVAGALGLTELFGVMEKNMADRRLKNKWGHTPMEMGNYTCRVNTPFGTSDAPDTEFGGLQLTPANNKR